MEKKNACAVTFIGDGGTSEVGFDYTHTNISRTKKKNISITNFLIVFMSNIQNYTFLEFITKLALSNKKF